MELKVNVADKTYDLGEHLVTLIGSVKSAISDGFQISDLIILGQAALADLAPISSDASGALAEAKSDLKGFLSAIALSSLDLGFSFKSEAKADSEEKADGKVVGSWISIVSFIISSAPQLISLAKQLISLLSSKSAEQKEAIKADLFKACESGDVAKVEESLKSHLEEKAPEKLEAPAEEKKSE